MLWSRLLLRVPPTATIGRWPVAAARCPRPSVAAVLQYPRFFATKPNNKNRKRKAKKGRPSASAMEGRIAFQESEGFKTKKANKNKNQTRKTKKGRPSASAMEGRIAIRESEGFKTKKTNSNSKMCAGCGTEVVYGKGGTEGKIFSTGADAAGQSSEQKKARYMDMSDLKGGEGGHFLCKRCKALKANNIWAAYDAIKDVDAKVFDQQLQYIVGRRRFGMCIVVADATDPEHSAPKSIRKSIGKTPAILVLSKADLLPRVSNRDIQSLQRGIEKILGTQFIASFAVSAHSGAGIFDLSEYLLNHLRGRDVFCVGAANVGKSTLVERLASTIAPAIYMPGKSKQAHTRKKGSQNLPVTASHLPGTTLQAVRVPCFRSPGHALWDTPGIIQSKAVQYSLFAPHFMEPLARPQPIPLVDGIQLRAGCSVLIEASWMDPEPAKDEPADDDLDDDHDDDDDDDDDDWYGESRKDRRDAGDAVHGKLNAPLPPVSETCTLARVDLLDVDEGNRIFVGPYLHPSLRVRVVSTKEAPSTATIPTHHIQSIQTLTGRTFGDAVTTRPLARYVHDQSPEGILQITDKEKIANGKIHLDLVFASLGWLHIVHDSDFSLVPWCVEGSIFSKRRSLYPSYLSQDDVEDQRETWEKDIAYLHSKDAQQRLDHASKDGRSQEFDPYVGQRQQQPTFDEEDWFI